MKTKLYLTVILIAAICNGTVAQNYIKIDTSFYSVCIQEDKNIDIYLPPDYYENPEQEYAAIYYMHGAGGDQNSGIVMAMQYYETHYEDTTNVNPAAIFVCMDGSCEPYSGSFSVNSILYGNYEDYVIQDVIGFVESNYRALPSKNFRFVTGWSMGGFGSAYHAARHPDVFRACVPCIGLLRSTSDTLVDIWKELVYQETGSYVLNYNAGLHNRLWITVCGAWSPNLDILPYYIESAFDTLGNYVDTVLQKWEAFDITSMVKDLPDEHELSWFLIAGKYDHMGFYISYLDMMDSLDYYEIAYDSSYFNDGHTYDPESWIKAIHWIDSIIDLSYLTQGILDYESEDLSLSLYPNPVSEVLHVGALTKISELTVYSISGHHMLKLRHSHQVDVSGLSPGIYILEARMDRGIVRKKFIKK